MHTLPASLRKWRPSASARANLLPHPHCPPSLRLPRHTNFFSPECSPSCLFLSCCLANAFPQTLQTNGLSSVCVLRCDLRLYARVKRFGQRLHWKVAGCFCVRFEAPDSPGTSEAGRLGSARPRRYSRLGTLEVDERRDLPDGEGEREPTPAAAGESMSLPCSRLAVPGEEWVRGPSDESDLARMRLRLRPLKLLVWILKYTNTSHTAVWRTQSAL